MRGYQFSEFKGEEKSDQDSLDENDIEQLTNDVFKMMKDKIVALDQTV